MTRVIHTGDTHLGYRQYHSPARRSDFLDAFRRVVEDAVAEGVDAVVHAGDLFHDRRPGLSDLLGTIDVLETLADADVPFLAVVGNHETKRDAQWLDLFETLGLATRLDHEPVVVGETAFYGLDFVPRSQRADLEYAFEPSGADHAALVSHGLFEPLVPDYGNVEWDIREVLAAATVDFDAVLLGDEHQATTERLDDGTWVTYCGSTERTSAGEREERGYNIVEFDGDVSIRRRGIETRAFVFVDLDLAEGEGFERVRDRLREHDLDGAVVHVSLAGAGEDVSAARVESFATEEGALVARVTDRREAAVEDELAVSFADPDVAVRDRVRELGLSRAARDLDETIRESEVADTNVADEVERHVSELLEEPSAFEPAPEVDPETIADRMTDNVEDTDASDAAADSDASDAAADNDASDSADDTDEVSVEPARDEAEKPLEGSSDEQGVDRAEPSQAGAGEDQASMEDYL